MTRPEEVVAAMSDAVLRGDVQAALDLISPSAIDHTPLPGVPDGHAGWLAKWQRLAETSAGVTMTVEQRVSTANTVASRYRFSRADTGELVGYGLDMIRVENGKIAEHWGLPVPG